MQFVLHFSLKEKVLPLEFRRTIISFIKKALTQDGEGKYYELFFRGTDIKPYTFSVKLPKPKFTEKGVVLSDAKFRVRFSTAPFKRREFILLNRIMGMKGVMFPLEQGNSMILEHIQMYHAPAVRTNQILVKSVVGGGICVRDHHVDNTETYKSAGDEDFELMLKRNIAEQLKRAGLQYANVDVHCAEGQKLIVRHFDMKIPVTKGYFVLSGERVALQYLLEAGIGSRRSQGFGMVELVTV